MLELWNCFHVLVILSDQHLHHKLPIIQNSPMSMEFWRWLNVSEGSAKSLVAALVLEISCGIGI